MIMIVGNPETRKDQSMVCRHVEGMERSFVSGSAAMDEKSAWAKVGELGLQKRVLNTDPSSSGVIMSLLPC